MKKGNRIYLLYVNLTRKWIPILAIIIFIIEQKILQINFEVTVWKIAFSLPNRQNYYKKKTKHNAPETFKM